MPLKRHYNLYKIEMNFFDDRNENAISVLDGERCKFSRILSGDVLRDNL